MFGGYLQETKTLVSPHSGLKPPIPSEKYNFMQTFYLPRDNFKYQSQKRVMMICFLNK